MIPRGPQPSYSPVRHVANNQGVPGKRSNMDSRGPPSVPSNKRFLVSLPSYLNILVHRFYT